MHFSPRFTSATRPSRLAAWRPFLTGVGVALAVLLVVAAATARPVEPAPLRAEAELAAIPAMPSDEPGRK